MDASYVGTTLHEAHMPCLLCPCGRYSAQMGVHTCHFCPRGKYAAHQFPMIEENGVEKCNGCESCTPGKTNSRVGQQWSDSCSLEAKPTVAPTQMPTYKKGSYPHSRTCAHGMLRHFTGRWSTCTKGCGGGYKFRYKVSVSCRMSRPVSLKLKQSAWCNTQDCTAKDRKVGRNRITDVAIPDVTTPYVMTHLASPGLGTTTGSPAKTTSSAKAATKSAAFSSSRVNVAAGDSGLDDDGPVSGKDDDSV